MDERYIASVDFGSSRIAVAVARVSGQDVQLIHYSDTPSRGVRNSLILNPGLAAQQLRGLISAAELELGIEINQVVAGLPRYGVDMQSARGSMERSDPNSPVSQEEIDYLKSNAVDTYPLEDSSKLVIYSVVPQSFSADTYIQTEESDLVGMISECIEGNFKVFIGRKRAEINVDCVMNNLGKVAACKVFTPESTARAVLTSDEMMNGVALVEIGAGTTSVSIYHKNILRYYAAIPFGAHNITTDIMLECGISERLAENIKLAYGACMPERLQTLRDKIIQIDNREAGTTKQLSVKYLSEIVTCRMQEICDAMLYKIQESGYADSLISGMVITGGGANLPNLSSFFKERSGYSVRIGYPLRKFIHTGCPGVTETDAAAAVGLILAVKDDLHLGCLAPEPEETVEPEAPAVEPEAPAVEPEPAAVEEQAVAEETVTAQPEPAWAPEPAQEPEPEPEAEPEAEKPQPEQGWTMKDLQKHRRQEEKRRKQQEKENAPEKQPPVIWQKISGMVKGLADKMYDGMEENDDE